MYKLWMFDFDNTIARLEPEVDWAGGRLILEPYLRSIGAPDELFARIPRGNLPLYDAYRTLMLAKSDQARVTEASPARFGNNREDRAGRSRSRAAARRRNRNIRGSEGERRRDRDRNVQLVENGRALVRPERRRRSVDAIVGRDTLLGLKPAPDMLLRALELFSVDRSDAAFVGDSDADLRAAQSCGVRFYGIAPTDSARDRLLAAGATEIFASPAALAIQLNLRTA